MTPKTKELIKYCDLCGRYGHEEKDHANIRMSQTSNPKHHSQQEPFKSPDFLRPADAHSKEAELIEKIMNQEKGICREDLYKLYQEAKSDYETMKKEMINYKDKSMELALELRKAKAETIRQVNEIWNKCGQLSGNAIRNNLKSDGKEYYVNVDEFEQAIKELGK